MKDDKTAGVSLGIYASEEWGKLALERERDIAARLAALPGTRDAAVKTLRRLHAVLSEDYRRQHRVTLAEAKKQTSVAFFMDKFTSAGQIGPGDSERLLEYLATEANLREVMTAVFNAVYFRAYACRKENAPNVPNKEISLQSTVNRIYYGNAPDPARAAALGLNESHLVPYTRFVASDPRLLALRAASQGHPTIRDNMGKDLLALGCITLYRGFPQFQESIRSVLSRTFRQPSLNDPGRSTPQDYARLGLPLSEAERAYLGADPRTAVIDACTTEELPYDPETDLPRREDLMKQQGVIGVQLNLLRA
ncbi:hypothetical protein [Streptomyces formicae]